MTTRSFHRRESARYRFLSTTPLPTTLLLLGLFLFPVRTAADQDHSVPERPQRQFTTEPVSSADVDNWRVDVAHLVMALEKHHPDPWRNVREPAFAEAVRKLHERIPTLAAHEIIVELARLLAMIGDGHTSLPLYMAEGVGFHIIPMRVGFYEDGVFIEGADSTYEELVGGRLVSIGGVPMPEVVGRISDLISRDNDNWIRAVAPNLINRIEVLHALGMTTTLEQVVVEVEIESERLVRAVEPLPTPQASGHTLPFLPEYTPDWSDARDLARRPVPLHQRHPEKIYWWTYEPDEDLLYIQWNHVQNRDHGPSALDVFREAMTAAREHQPKRTVIDIRNNPGGRGELLPAIVREIVRTREIDEPGRLFVVTGRRTFSAAQAFTAMLERFTTAILVGEPSSAFYNGPAGHAVVELPRSGIKVMISPDYYQMGDYPGDSRQQATPQLAAIPSFEDYRTNRDPVLEVVLDYEPGREEALAEAILEALDAGDRERALELGSAFDSDPVNRFISSARTINSLGYRKLREHDTAGAIEIFQLNVELHPEYANGWDSLGEAWVHAGSTDQARAAFRRALSLDPRMNSAAVWLARLEEGEDPH